jgi:hypothetical protein
MYTVSSNELKSIPAVRIVWSLLLSVCILVVAGCGSTKVYNAQKTVVYRGSIYNVSNVMVYSSRIEGVVSEDETLDLKGLDKKAIQRILAAHPSILVRQIITMDEQEILYQARLVNSWSDFRKISKQFERANRDLQEFIGDPAESQLELD